MAKQALTEKQAVIHSFLMNTRNEKHTAYELADALDIERKSINILITGMATKGYVVREEAEGTDDEGKKVIVKYVVLTDAGVNYDAVAAAEADAIEAEAAKEARKAKKAAEKDAE